MLKPNHSCSTVLYSTTVKKLKDLTNFVFPHCYGNDKIENQLTVPI